MLMFALHAFVYPESDYIISELFPDSPYDVADKWLLKESLPLSYRQQVVDFILQNSGQNNFTFNASFRDPYTDYFLLETIKKVTTAPALAANLLTNTRVVANLSSFHEWLQRNRSEVLDVFLRCSSSNKNVQLSYSTLIINNKYHACE